LSIIWSVRTPCSKCGAEVIACFVKKKGENTFECPRCKADVIISENSQKEPVQIFYRCYACGAGKKKAEAAQPAPEDVQKIAELDTEEIPYWYPRNRLVYDDGRPFLKRERSENISELFSKRNLNALAMILDEIEKEPDRNLRDIFKVIFSSCLEQSSKLNAVDLRAGRELQTRGWTIYSYWTATTVIERNVWDAFEDRYDKWKRAKLEVSQQLPKVLFASTFKELKRKKKPKELLLLEGNALNLQPAIPDDSVDYVFTDPPYGMVQYGELSYLWNAWLKQGFDFKQEIVINPRQGKDFDYFHRMLCAAFKELFRVMKPQKYFTLTFHSPNIQIWNSIIKASVIAGFKIEKIIYQPPAVRSAKASFQPFGSAVGDFYVRFRKPKTVPQLKLKEEADRSRYERVVVHTATRVIAARGEPTSYSIIINAVYPELITNGVLLDADKDIEEIMKEHLEKEFVLVDRKDIWGKKIGQEWWFKDPSSVRFLKKIPLNERVEKTVIDVLNDKMEVTLDDILDKIYTTFPNALTPDTDRILDYLEEYATKVKAGRWLRKPEIMVKQREKEHNELVRLVAELGNQMGFHVYADIDGYREDFPRLAKLGPTAIARVKEIDVLWHDGCRVIWEFEVEHTTGISEAIIRGSNLPPNGMRRTLVMPIARRRLLQRKMQEPMLSEKISQYGWNVIFFEAVRQLAESKETPSIAEIERLCNLPQALPQPQQPTLKAFLGNAEIPP
jgi:hypothetical protein